MRITAMSKNDIDWREEYFNASADADQLANEVNLLRLALEEIIELAEKARLATGMRRGL
jgi:hypothetical protein